MMIARWQIDARFGHKGEVIASVKWWGKEIGSQLGWTSERMRILEGSIGARESTVVTEVEVDDLADLNRAWSKLATIEAHRTWSKELEPKVVSGSTRWEVYRIA